MWIILKENSTEKCIYLDAFKKGEGQCLSIFSQCLLVHPISVKKLV